MVTVIFAHAAHSPLHHLAGCSHGGETALAEHHESTGCCHEHANSSAEQQGNPKGSRHSPTHDSRDCELCQMLSQSLQASVPPVLLAGQEAIEVLSQAGLRQFRLAIVDKPFSRGPPVLA